MLKHFTAFSLSQLSDAASVLKVMERVGISAEAFRAAVAGAVEEKREQVRADAVRKAGRSTAAGTVSAQNRRASPADSGRHYPETLDCPKCHGTAYAQPVCPSCKKGRAGIRREYICGECNFTFYLD